MYAMRKRWRTKLGCLVETTIANGVEAITLSGEEYPYAQVIEQLRVRLPVRRQSVAGSLREARAGTSGAA